MLQTEFLPDELGQPLHGGLEPLLRGDAEGGPQVLAGRAAVRLEGAARHQHDVLNQSRHVNNYELPLSHLSCSTEPRRGGNIASCTLLLNRLGNATLHDHVPGVRDAGHPQPEEHPAERDGELRQPGQVAVSRSHQQVPPPAVETLNSPDMLWCGLTNSALVQLCQFDLCEALEPPLVQQAAGQHLQERAAVVLVVAAAPGRGRRRAAPRPACGAPACSPPVTTAPSQTTVTLLAVLTGCLCTSSAGPVTKPSRIPELRILEKESNLP